MAENRKYNGWANYETWNVALWMGESGDFYAEIAGDIFRQTKGNEYLSQLEQATSDFADSLKTEHEENMPEVTGCYSDLLGAALSEVDWYEIAEHYQEFMEEEK